MEENLSNSCSPRVGEQGWAIKYCLNRLSELRNLSSILKHLLIDGGVGGDIEWGVHKWDRHAEDDYGVSKFDGYRYYVGENEHGISGLGDIEEYTSEERLKQLLSPIIMLYIQNHPAEAIEFRGLANELGVVI